jgi:hypothetical protein
MPSADVGAREFSTHASTPALASFTTLRKYVVVVTTGRSGSHFFTHLVNTNARNASSEHEVNLVSPDVSTKWYYDGQDDRIERLIVRRLRRLRRGETLDLLGVPRAIASRLTRARMKKYFPTVPIKEVYVDVDNAILKSFGPPLLQKIPDLQVVHVTRHPMLQAKSAENRHTEPNPQRPYFLWPGWQRNFLPLEPEILQRLSRFQLALWYWLEMEIRYVEFFQKRCVVPPIELDIAELNRPETAATIFARLGIEHGPMRTDVDRDSSPRESVATDEDWRQARDLLDLLPKDVLSRVTMPYDLAAS